jgi:uncharacterized protein YbjT (DUF2867 family)
MTFRILIIGGTGQVGTAVVRALVDQPSCTEIVMVNRRTVSAGFGPRVSQVTLDTADASLQAEVTKLARSMVAKGEPVFAASCVGVGRGSLRWSEQHLMALEVGMVSVFARGCEAAGIETFALLSAVGSTPKSRFRYVHVMGLKEDAIRKVGFRRLAIFRPGIIGGNAHTRVTSLG